MIRIDFNRLRFLVIDDNAHMRRILRTLLHGFGAREVYEAEDGASGLEAFTHYVLSQFVVTPCWTKRPEAIERQMRSQCQRFLMAKLGDDILNPYVDYEAAKDEQRQLKAMFRLLSKSKPKTKRRR